MNKNNLLRRYWFDFEFKSAFELPGGVALGCGVTAFNQEDALNILDEKIFAKIKRPPIKRTIEDIDIRTLDPGHVIPNMGVVIFRGIWFPLGYA